MTARVVHVSEKVEGAVYIGRAMPRQRLKASKWANPFTVKEHGRKGAIILYSLYLSETPDLIASIPELRNKPLACWCRREHEQKTPVTACHGDTLLAWLDAYTDDELRERAR